MCAKNRIGLAWEKAAHNITVRTGVVGVSWRHRSEDGEGYAQAFFIAVAFDFDSEILLKSLQPRSSRLIGIRDTGSVFGGESVKAFETVKGLPDDVQLSFHFSGVTARSAQMKRWSNEKTYHTAPSSLR